jgi:hypothetical protein
MNLSVIFVLRKPVGTIHRAREYTETSSKEVINMAASRQGAKKEVKKPKSKKK